MNNDRNTSRYCLKLLHDGIKVIIHVRVFSHAFPFYYYFNFVILIMEDRPKSFRILEPIPRTPTYMDNVTSDTGCIFPYLLNQLKHVRFYYEQV